MNTLTYRQAYDKIIEAYFRDEMRPFEPEFCFCGTLSPNSNWYNCPYESSPRLSDSAYPYSVSEYAKMEKALFSRFPNVVHNMAGDVDYIGTIPEYIKRLGKRYEAVLFEGMCEALDVLKEIHRSRGENVDEEIPTFTKRKLQVVDERVDLAVESVRE